MHVRNAQVSDNQAICTVAMETFSLACPSNTPLTELQNYVETNFTPASFEKILRDEHCIVRVIEVDNKIIGFSLIDLAPEDIGQVEADGIPELTRCYVLQPYHGTGAAQVLLSATIADVTSPLRLMVNDQNARAIRFYERNGFRQVGETSFQCGADTHRDLVMVRQLT